MLLFLSFLQQALPSKLNLARCLTGLEPSLGDADTFSFPHLELLFVGVPGARAVMWEMYAGECVRAQVPVANGYSMRVSEP